MDNPESPEKVFHDSVQVSDLKRQLAGVPPVYVETVYYGRMLVIKMELSEKATEEESKLAFKFLYEGTTGKANTDLKIKKIADESTYSVAVIGGSASVAKSLKMKDLLKNFIHGNEFSSENRGVPIFYKARFLKDNRFCNIGNPCEWSQTESKILNSAFVGFKNKGGFFARCTIKYERRVDGKTHSENTGWINCGQDKKFHLQGDAANIVLKVEIKSGPNHWWTKFTEYPNLDNRTFVVWGALCDVHSGWEGGNKRKRKI